MMLYNSVMMKKLLFIFACLALLVSCSAAPPDPNAITGLWKSRDQYSDTPRSLVVFYEHDGKYYGRMIGTYDADGNFNDTISEQKDKAKGVVGNPPYCGMDFVYDLKPLTSNENRYRGKIVDPEKGNVYNVEIWRDGNRLMVRGELWIFGKTIPWVEGSTHELPKGFSMSQIKSFVPVIPKVE